MHVDCWSTPIVCHFVCCVCIVQVKIMHNKQSCTVQVPLSGSSYHPQPWHQRWKRWKPWRPPPWRSHPEWWHRLRSWLPLQSQTAWSQSRQRASSRPSWLLHVLRSRRMAASNWQACLTWSWRRRLLLLQRRASTPSPRNLASSRPNRLPRPSRFSPWRRWRRHWTESFSDFWCFASRGQVLVGGLIELFQHQLYRSFLLAIWWVATFSEIKRHALHGTVNLRITWISYIHISFVVGFLALCFFNSLVFCWVSCAPGSAKSESSM